MLASAKELDCRDLDRNLELPADAPVEPLASTWPWMTSYWTWRSHRNAATPCRLLVIAREGRCADREGPEGSSCCTAIDRKRRRTRTAGRYGRAEL